jgi:uncharacterized repeat protein (TIGR01451 family)
MRLTSRRGLRTSKLPNRRRALGLERLEDRTVPAVSILNGGGATGLNFSTSTNDYGNVQSVDDNGAAGPAAYVETANHAIELFPTKGVSTNGLTDGLEHFFFTTGGLPRTDSHSYTDYPVVAYDELIGRFVVYDNDVDNITGGAAFDIAVSRSSNPTTLSTADWAFYKINNTESGYWPGNISSIAYNADAIVFTANMYGSSRHVMVVSIKAADLKNAAPSPSIVKNDLNDWSVAPTTMHGSVSGDPMWLVHEHGDNQSMDVIKMTGELTSSPSFTYTNLAVTPYSAVVTAVNPDGTAIPDGITSGFRAAAETNGTLVAAQSVGVSSTQDVIQWYAINVGTGSPSLAQQGRVGGNNNTYAVYPGIDINLAGQIGMTYMQMGTDTATDFLSMWVTARTPADAPGTMEPPVLVPAGTGQANYSGYGGVHIADESGINLDPVDNSFWAVHTFANNVFPENWGTAIAHFMPGLPAGNTDLSVTATGPSAGPLAVLPGASVAYTITLTNNGPLAAQNVVLTDALPAGATFGSLTQTSGPDAFTFGQSGNTVSETATADLAVGSSDTFTLVVTAPNGPLGANFSDSASVTSTTPDANQDNSSATVAGAILGPPADLVVTTSTPASVTEGNNITYTVIVTNSGSNSATGVVLTDTLTPYLRYVSATATQGTVSYANGQTVPGMIGTYVNGIVTDTVGFIAANTSVTLTVTAQVIRDIDLGHSATATATSADPNADNNTAAAIVAANDPSIVVSGPITTSSKTLSNVTVATFTYANGVERTIDFSATINWGDGTTSAGTITESGTTYSVTGSHSYSGNPHHTITTTVTKTSPQLAVSRGPNVDVVPLTQAQLDAADAAAIRAWADAGLPAADLARMTAAEADIADLPGDHLGAAMLNGNEFAIDPTADGWGWSVDVSGKPAAGRMDLLTVVEHELGHIVGLDSRFTGDSNDLMYAYLSPGVRRLPGAADVPASAVVSTDVRPAAEDQIDWLTAVVSLKPKGLYADWLAPAEA